jgi:YihY family inner membrane protein
MSTANAIPETWELTGDDARRTLHDAGRARLIRDAFKRLRAADGFSHARSIGLLLSLVLIEGVIALVGLASILTAGGLSDAIVRGLQRAIPGPAGSVLTDAVTQAHRAASGSRSFALWFGLAAAIVTGTTLFGQFERGTNRIYGIETDRSTLRKYGTAFGLLCSAGALAGLAFVCIAVGSIVATTFHDDLWVIVWNIARWPVGLLLMTASIALILRRAPRRHQPDWSWLSMGALLAVTLWVLVTVGFGLFFGASSTFGTTYGPLAGIVALMLWSYVSAAAVLYGVAVAAQLEAIRAGVAAPQSAQKAAVTPPRRSRTPVRMKPGLADSYR